jgi:gluconate 2-dehydrogenase alpha chain
VGIAGITRRRLLASTGNLAVAVAIARGPWRDPASSFNIGYAPDELRYGARLDLFQRPAQGTPASGSSDQETAPPIRCGPISCSLSIN